MASSSLIRPWLAAAHGPRKHNINFVNLGLSLVAWLHSNQSRR